MYESLAEKFEHLVERYPHLVSAQWLEGFQWPPHRELGLGSRSNFKTFKPEIASAMRNQGMRTFGHLSDRVQWLAEQPGISEMFEGANPHSNHISALISKNNTESDSRVYAKDGFTRTAELVAMALETTPEDLFGELPLETHSIERDLHYNNVRIAPIEDLWNQKQGMPEAVIRAITGMGKFSDRNKEILLRFAEVNRGIKSPGYAQIAEEFEISDARARQIVQNGLKKLRTSSAYEQLKLCYQSPDAEDMEMPHYEPHIEN